MKLKTKIKLRDREKHRKTAFTKKIITARDKIFKFVIFLSRLSFCVSLGLSILFLSKISFVLSCPVIQLFLTQGKRFISNNVLLPKNFEKYLNTFDRRFVLGSQKHTVINFYLDSNCYYIAAYLVTSIFNCPSSSGVANPNRCLGHIGKYLQKFQLFGPHFWENKGKSSKISRKFVFGPRVGHPLFQLIHYL